MSRQARTHTHLGEVIEETLRLVQGRHAANGGAASWHSIALCRRCWPSATRVEPALAEPAVPMPFWPSGARKEPVSLELRGVARCRSTREAPWVWCQEPTWPLLPCAIPQTACRAADIGPYFSNHFSTAREVGRGTGLGLAVGFHGVMQTRQGAVGVRKHPGPRQPVCAVFPGTQLAVAVPSLLTEPEISRTPPEGAGSHVMYVDDDEALVFLGATRAQSQRFYGHHFQRCASRQRHWPAAFTGLICW